MQSYKLFLDDERQPNQVTWVNIHIDNRPWVVVKSYEEFVAHIEANGLPDFVSFDHDLAFGHYHGDFTGEKTGLDAAKWMTQYCETHKLKFPWFAVHSMSSVGRVNIMRHINEYIARVECA